jgi:uncharacterized protein (DUF1330 family)
MRLVSKTLLAASVACLALWNAPAAFARHRPFGGSGSVRTGGGHFARHPGGNHRLGGGQAGKGPRTATYDVIEAKAVTDKAGFAKTIGTLGASLARSNGRVLADVDTTDALVGSTPTGSPVHLSVIVFDNVASAQAWRNSPAFRQMTEALRNEATVAVYEAGGVADPGPKAPAATEPRGAVPGSAERKLLEMPKINDICRGC